MTLPTNVQHSYAGNVTGPHGLHYGAGPINVSQSAKLEDGAALPSRLTDTSGGTVTWKARLVRGVISGMFNVSYPPGDRG